MDPCSSVKPEGIITHVELEITPIFASKEIYGRAVYSYTCTAQPFYELILDMNHIEILSSSVSTYTFGLENPVFGKSLCLKLPCESGTFTLTFKTRPEATAVQFLEPSQTAGKEKAFCYTQCQAIHCRSLLPIQDTPSIKFTINYHISAPEGYVAVAAGVFQSTTDSIPGFKVYHFSQRIPIPAYLVAFAIGNLTWHILNPKSTVYCEPELEQVAANEFAEINLMLEAAEEIMTPYFWGKLDLIVLPPSFPFGGMENPNLIFVTPTILAGDRSLTNLVAHEIAHSWTGNAVTNSTWEHFWLNEGFTVYFERKITKKVFGLEISQLEQANGVEILRKTVELIGNEHNFTRLNVDLTGMDPDDAFSPIPYEKGCIFLLYLENLVGESVFLQFLREYVSTFQGKHIDSYGFKDLFLSKFTVDIDWETWLKGPGMPPWLPIISNTLLDSVQALFENLPNSSPSISDLEGWRTEQIVAFLNLLLKRLDHNTVHICETYGFHTSKNCEIQVLWLNIVITLKLEKYYPDVSQFLQGQGRMKYVRPLFRALHESGLLGIAQEIFEKSKNFYHSTLVFLLRKEFNYH